jgi:hypothetical protein
MEEDDLGFTFVESKDGSVSIYHDGQFATKFRKNKAAQILSQFDVMDFDEQQQLMARLTGNYKHGNERVAKNHLRNRGY